MNALGYLWGRTFKNRFLEVLKKPTRLIAYLLVIAALVFMLALPSRIPHNDTPSAPPYEGFAAILLAIFYFIFTLSIFNGLKQGTSMFSMSDVNFLFPSPIPPRRVLLMGVLRQAGAMLYASFFLLFQYPNMRMNGLPITALIGLMLSYMLLGFVTNLLSALIYAYSSASENRRKYVQIVLLALVAVPLGAYLITAFDGADIMGSLARFFGHSAWQYLPLIGWARGLAMGITQGTWLIAAVYLALLSLAAGGCLLVLRRSDMDYYEDVLLGAERANQTREDAQAGRVVERGDVSRRVKREKGAMWGTGAWALTGRVLREESRRGLWIFDLNTIAAAGVPFMAIVFGMRGEMIEQAGVLPLFSIVAWMQMFLQLQTGFARELTFPSIYLVPARPFSKLCAIMVPQAAKAFLNGFLFAVAACVLHGFTIGNFLGGMFGYATLSLLLNAALLLTDRILGASKNRVLIMVIYIFINIFLVFPGIVIASIVAVTVDGGMLSAYLILCGWNFLAALLLLFLCRNMLHTMEMG
ncbi:putative ABC exporter domain-containing protein [Christensenellaceae bacterium OttesenSCG-928-L17]|nr:putative ABC exporter domain-containing protein [Christensenellaceae bacterium OttesenSCG-928-L17]